MALGAWQASSRTWASEGSWQKQLPAPRTRFDNGLHTLYSKLHPGGSRLLSLVHSSEAEQTSSETNRPQPLWGHREWLCDVEDFGNASRVLHAAERTVGIPICVRRKRVTLQPCAFIEIEILSPVSS